MHPRTIKQREYRARNYEYYKRCLEKQKLKFKALRLSLLKILAERCVRCGYNDDVRALNIDHINGGGTKQYKKMGNGPMYKYYLSHPDLALKELQVLCCNCNAIKRYEKNEWMKPYKHFPNISN